MEVNVIIYGYFLMFCFCCVWYFVLEWVNGDGGGGLFVGVYGKVVVWNEDGVVYVFYRYFMNIYIISYNVINI